MSSSLLQTLDRGHFPVARGHAHDRTHLARVRVVVQLGGHDVIRRDDAVERGENHFARRRGDDVEREAIAVDPLAEEIDELRNVRSQPDLAPGLLEMLAADRPERWVVPDQIGELSPLLYQVGCGEPGDFTVEIGHAQKLREDATRVVKAEGLVEVRREQKVLGRFRGLRHVCSSGESYRNHWI